MAECVCNVIIDDGSDTTRVDGQPTYMGRAKPGVGTDEVGWQIEKFFYDANNNYVLSCFADGDAGFNFEYDERDTYTYTPTGA